MSAATAVLARARSTSPAPFALVSVVAGGRVERLRGLAIAAGADDAVSFGEVYAAAVRLEVDTVFMVGGLVLVDEQPSPVEVEVTGDQGGAWRWRLSTPASFLCGPGAPGRVGGQAVNVVDVLADQGRVSGPWDGLEAGEVVAALAAAARLLGVPWGSSVGRTAERLILSTHPRARGGTLLDRAPKIPDPCAGSSLEQPWVSWRRELTAGEAAAGWLHSFDANAQYLGAWSTVELGHGVPIHHARPVFDGRNAGVWRVPGLSDARAPFGELLPVPWLPNREWFTTPTLARAFEVLHGLELPEVTEAWIWPGRSRFLRKAAERLGKARAAAMVERSRQAGVLYGAGGEVSDETLRRFVISGVVLEAVKAVYRMQTGRFGMAARDEASPWHRPDWGHEIRAQARVNLHRRLVQLGAAPFGIATDGLLFLSDERDPARFAESIRLPVGDALGQFHHGATVPAGAVDELGTARPRQIFERMGAVAYA